MDFCGNNITVKTLTVLDVREVLEDLRGTGDGGEDKDKNKKKSVFDLHIVDLLINDDVPAIAISKATGLTLDELGGAVDPQLVADLATEVRAKNPFFVGMMRRLNGSAGAEKVEPLPPKK